MWVNKSVAHIAFYSPFPTDLFGLYPNVSTDYYGRDNLQRFMQDEEQLSQKAAEYKAAIEQAATNGNETAQEILNDLNTGNRVICYDDEKNVIAHLVNPKELKRKAV